MSIQYVSSWLHMHGLFCVEGVPFKPSLFKTLSFFLSWRDVYFYRNVFLASVGWSYDFYPSFCCCALLYLIYYIYYVVTWGEFLFIMVHDFFLIWCWIQFIRIWLRNFSSVLSQIILWLSLPLPADLPFLIVFLFCSFGIKTVLSS